MAVQVREIKISQRLGDSWGSLHLYIVAPQYLLWLWPLYIAHSKEHGPGWCLVWLRALTRVGGKTQMVLLDKHRGNCWHKELPAILSCGAQQLQGCNSDDTWGALPASPACSSVSQYSQIHSWLSHPACHDNAANLPAAVAAERPAKEGVDLPWGREKELPYTRFTVGPMDFFRRNLQRKPRFY